MAQIFVSHSAKDKSLVDFICKAGASTKVRLVVEEFEKIISGEITSARVMKDIRESNALFVLLGPNVHKLPHTRDWVLSEAGVGSNKDIWVIEPYSDLGNMDVVIPFLRHYVIMTEHESFQGYMRKIIESYDDSQVVAAGAIGAGLGAAWGPVGAVVGGFIGMAGESKSKKDLRPSGLQMKCVKCTSIYNLHFPEGLSQLRCPVCNVVLNMPNIKTA